MDLFFRIVLVLYNVYYVLHEDILDYFILLHSTSFYFISRFSKFKLTLLMFVEFLMVIEVILTDQPWINYLKQSF